MGFLIAAVAGTAMIVALVVAAFWLTRRSGPEHWGKPGRDQTGRYLGEGCACGRGQMQIRWRHGAGNVLQCSAYPVCRIAYQFNGQELSPRQEQVLTQTR
jgi:ssDNA-binding Zn-finger/Zn-ribbon topoisomerase 1